MPVKRLRVRNDTPKRSSDAREGVGTMEWISVHDRLPELEKEVLVYDSFGNMYIGLITDGWKGLYWVDEECINISDIVTHWMPLPEPPKDFNKI